LEKPLSWLKGLIDLETRKRERCEVLEAVRRTTD